MYNHDYLMGAFSDIERAIGYFRTPVLSVTEKLVTKCNAIVFFGPELCMHQDLTSYLQLLTVS
jgi:hypothetical protein